MSTIAGGVTDCSRSRQQELSICVESTSVPCLLTHRPWSSQMPQYDRGVFQGSAATWHVGALLPLVCCDYASTGLLITTYSVQWLCISEMSLPRGLRPAPAALPGWYSCCCFTRLCLAPGGWRRHSHATTRPGPADLHDLSVSNEICTQQRGGILMSRQ